jgi:hypothetical protein
VVLLAREHAGQLELGQGLVQGAGALLGFLGGGQVVGLDRELEQDLVVGEAAAQAVPLPDGLLESGLSLSSAWALAWSFQNSGTPAN